MSGASVNLKSDVRAKAAFVAELVRRGFTARVTGRPADVTAVRNGETFYFEIKYTSKSDRYFGAATLTEWEAALQHEGRFRFVIATETTKGWQFVEYTPEEFAKYSYI